MENSTVVIRRENEKNTLIGILKEMPIIQIACKKAGVSRATYYRWRNEDADFSNECDLALIEGIDFINDMGESQIIQLIKNQELPAITLWLKNNHPRYGAKNTQRNLPSPLEKLSPKEEEIFKKALDMINYKKNQKTC